MSGRTKYLLALTGLGLLALFCLAVLLSPGQPEEPAVSPAQTLSADALSRPVTVSPSPSPTLTPAPAADLTFAIAGGSAAKGGEAGAVCTQTLSAALRSAKDQGAAFVVMLGDLATGSVFPDVARANLEAFADCAFQYFDPEDVYPVFGLQESHHKGRNQILDPQEDPEEFPNKVEKDYKLAIFSEVFCEFTADSFCHDVYGKTAYAFTAQDCNFIVLNTKWYEQMDRVSSTVVDWLKSYAENGVSCNLVFLYGSPYPLCDVKTEMDADYSTTTDDEEEKTNAQYRDELLAAIGQLPSPVIFCGSESLYARREVDGVLQVSCSGLGWEFDRSLNSEEGLLFGPCYQNHYLLCGVYPDRLEFSAIDPTDGSVIDRFAVEK